MLTHTPKKDVAQTKEYRFWVKHGYPLYLNFPPSMLMKEVKEILSAIVSSEINLYWANSPTEPVKLELTLNDYSKDFDVHRMSHLMTPIFQEQNNILERKTDPKPNLASQELIDALKDKFPTDVINCVAMFESSNLNQEVCDVAHLLDSKYGNIKGIYADFYNQGHIKFLEARHKTLQELASQYKKLQHAAKTDNEDEKTIPSSDDVERYNYHLYNVLTPFVICAKLDLMLCALSGIENQAPKLWLMDFARNIYADILKGKWLSLDAFYGVLRVNILSPHLYVEMRVHLLHALSHSMEMSDEEAKESKEQAISPAFDLLPLVKLEILNIFLELKDKRKIERIDSSELQLIFQSNFASTLRAFWGQIIKNLGIKFLNTPFSNFDKMCVINKAWLKESYTFKIDLAILAKAIHQFLIKPKAFSLIMNGTKALGCFPIPSKTSATTAANEAIDRPASTKSSSSSSSRR